MFSFFCDKSVLILFVWSQDLTFFFFDLFKYFSDPFPIIKPINVFDFCLCFSPTSLFVTVRSTSFRTSFILCIFWWDHWRGLVLHNLTVSSCFVSHVETTLKEYERVFNETQTQTVLWDVNRLLNWNHNKERYHKIPQSTTELPSACVFVTNMKRFNIQ